MNLYQTESIEIITQLCQYLLNPSIKTNDELYDQIIQYLTWVIKNQQDTEFINIGYRLIKQCEEITEYDR